MADQCLPHWTQMAMAFPLTICLPWIPDGATIWHRTGDAGYFDDLGRLWLLGRLGSQVELRGRPVFPFSIEVAARGWEGVANCALLATSDGACLVLEGQDRYGSAWLEKANQLGVPTVRSVARIPMDRRHASRIDRSALRKSLAL